MAFSNKIEISDFSGGLISDLEAAKLPASASSRLENCDVRNKFLQTLPGVAEVNTGLPDGFVKISEEQFLFTEPSEEEVTLVYGTLSGADKLYVRPYLSPAGAWVDSWLDLTEAETGLTADAGSGGDVTDTTHIVDAGLSSSTDDYYNGWIVYNSTRTASAIITDYDGSAKKLTLSWTITSQVAGDSYFIARNPVYNISGTLLFNPSSDGCRFLQRDNIIDIITGSDAIYDSTATPKKVDLHLSIKNSYKGFDDTDLNFTGFYLTRKPPGAAGPMTSGLSEQNTGTGEQDIDAGNYLVLPIFVYDGFQEGPLWRGDLTPFDGTRYNILLGSKYVTITTTGKKIQVDFLLYVGSTGGTKVPIFTPTQGKVADGQDSLIFDRRITAIRLYVAQAAQISANTAKPTSEWRFVKEVDIDSADWSGTGPHYTQTIYITGDEWEANAGIDIADRQGHASLKVHANASFIASAKKRVAVTNVYVDERRQSFVFFSAINADEQNTPDVIPHTSFLDLSLYGIPKIMGFVEAGGYWTAIGENMIVKIDATTLSVDKNTQQRGASSQNGVISVDNWVYFTGLEDCYRYSPRHDIAPSIMTGFVRDGWKALPKADRQTAAIGYDGNYNFLVIAAGTQIYLYHLPQIFASDLAQDTQAIGSWSVFSVNKIFLKFYTALDRSCVGIADDGKTYTFFSPNADNTMVYEKVLGEGDFNLHTLRIVYNAASIITAKIFDLKISSIYPIKTYKFPAKSTHSRFDRHEGCHVKRPMLQVSAGINARISEIIINPQVLDDA
jgi:hypothetical protein